MTQVRLSDKVLPAFHEFWLACNEDKYLYKVLKGGRNSSKSTHISLRIIYEMMKYKTNALVIRKVAATLSESVFEQLIWAIDYLNVGPYWKATKSPLGLTYLPWGNRIIFRGGDEPQKIKSIKTSKYPLTILWIEELPEFKTEDEVDVIVNSVLRAKLPKGLKYSIFFSYNPPKRKQNWVNKKFNTVLIPDNIYVHHSDYRDNPYCSDTFLEEVANTKKLNKHKHDWIYLGKPIGGGVVPFSNLSFRKITDAEIRSFDNIRQGLDWGYAADPLAFVRTHLDLKSFNPRARGGRDAYTATCRLCTTKKTQSAKGGNKGKSVTSPALPFSFFSDRANSAKLPEFSVYRRFAHLQNHYISSKPS